MAGLGSSVGGSRTNPTRGSRAHRAGASWWLYDNLHAWRSTYTFVLHYVRPHGADRLAPGQVQLRLFAAGQEPLGQGGQGGPELVEQLGVPPSLPPLGLHDLERLGAGHGASIGAA